MIVFPVRLKLNQILQQNVTQADEGHQIGKQYSLLLFGNDFLVYKGFLYFVDNKLQIPHIISFSCDELFKTCVAMKGCLLHFHENLFGSECNHNSVKPFHNARSRRHIYITYNEV